MTDTPNIKLPIMDASQAQKHVTHNEAIRDLDALVHLSVLDRDLTIAPASPANGDRYLVATGATGIWAAKDGEIAAYQDGAWTFHTPKAGWVCWIGDESILKSFDGANWINVIGTALQNLSQLGVNTTADATNRLSAKSDGILFSHDDVTPGTGDIRTNLNKKAVANTASFLFQNGFSGRGEIGLTGDDDFHFKVSPDGSTFYEGIKIDKDDGVVTLPNGIVVSTIGGGADFQGNITVSGTVDGRDVGVDGTKLDGIEASADVTDAANIAAAGAPIITTGAGAPGSTPAAVGDIYVDTTSDNVYVAAGTVSSADWKQATGAGGGDLLAANNLSDVANAATARTNLGVAIGSDVQAHSAALDAVTGTNTGDEPAASATVAGKVELATIAEVDTGTDATRAITPAGLKGSALQTKVDAIEASADVTDAANVAGAGAPIISTGAGAPGSTPAAVGDIYVDTTSDNVYVAAGTVSSADWKQATGVGGGDLLAANNLSDLANAATARTNLGLGNAATETLGKQTIWIPAGAMTPATTSGAASGQVEETTNKHNYATLDFDATADEFACFEIMMPKSWDESTITFYVVWSTTATGTTGMAFALQGVAVADAGNSDVVYGTAVLVTDDAQTGAGDVLVSAVSAALTIAGAPAAGELCQFRVYRDVSNANDDMTQDMQFRGIQILYNTDTLKDD